VRGGGEPAEAPGATPSNTRLDHILVLIVFWSRKTSFRGPIRHVFRDQNTIFAAET
jgi:hypothetical protein